MTLRTFCWWGCLLVVGVLSGGWSDMAPAAVFQHLDASIASSVEIDGSTGNVSVWQDQSGNGRDATHLNGPLTYPTKSFPTGLPGISFTIDRPNSLNSRMTVLSPENAETLLNGPNGFSIFIAVDGDLPDNAVANDWNDLLATASTAPGPTSTNLSKSFGIRWAYGLQGQTAPGPTGVPGDLATYLNGTYHAPPFGAETASNGVARTTPNHAYGAGDPFVVAVTFDRANQTLRLMSSLDDFLVNAPRPVPGDIDFGDGNPLWLGGVSNNAGRAFWGRIGEILILDNGLSEDAFRSQVGALHSKWIVPEPGAGVLVLLAGCGLLVGPLGRKHGR